MNGNDKDRNPFLGMLWADSAEIRKDVENYNLIKWYKSVRFIPVFWVLIVTLFYELYTGKIYSGVWMVGYYSRICNVSSFCIFDGKRL